MLHEFWQNFTHNLFKPLLLFFYLGFLIPILKVRFEFPYVIYQGLMMYLLLAIGWHGGEELAEINRSDIDNIVGFMIVGFVLNFVIGVAAYFLLNHMTRIRRVDRATLDDQPKPHFRVQDVQRAKCEILSRKLAATRDQQPEAADGRLALWFAYQHGLAGTDSGKEDFIESKTGAHDSPSTRATSPRRHPVCSRGEHSRLKDIHIMHG